MRVLHIISGGDTGGAKTHVFTLLKQLQKEIDVELVCLSDGIFYREAVELGLKVVLIQQKRRMDLSILKMIADKVNHEKFQIIHCHGARANFLSYFFRKKVSVPIITTIHSDYKLDFAHSFYKNLIFTPINRISLSKMDGYLAVTGIFKDDLVSRGFPKEKIHVIYNGIDILDRKKDYTGCKANKMVLGCATRLMPIKGTDVLLKALDHMKQKGYEPLLRIAGNGDLKYTEKLKSFVKEKKLEQQVEFLGFVKDMEGFYRSIDINILPSYTEGFPYALLESGERGICTVASKAGGIVEMIEDRVSGCLFDVGNHEELAKILMEILDGKISAKELGEGFRERVVQRFSAEAMADSHIKIYQSYQ